MTDLPSAPPYGSGTLADVVPAAAALLGVAPAVAGSTALQIEVAEGDVAGVTILLVDGWGWSPWAMRAGETPALASMDARVISSTFPSTTPTALAALGTALPPGEHGLVGASFLLPEEGELLRPLNWERDPHPRAVQPEPTAFERLVRHGLSVSLVGPTAYHASGLTQAGLRGGDYVGADSLPEVVDGVVAHRSGLTYAYTPDLDRTGHVHGVDSDEWTAALRDVDRLVERLLEGLTERHVLVVTSDHGMVDCPGADRVSVEGLPGAHGVLIAGEPRMRHIYCGPDVRDDLVRQWRSELGDRAWIATRDEAIHAGLFGVVQEDYRDRIGDIIAIARGTTALVSETDAMVSGLRGQHGSLSAEEMGIPLAVARGRRRG